MPQLPEGTELVRIRHKHLLLLCVKEPPTSAGSALRYLLPGGLPLTEILGEGGGPGGIDPRDVEPLQPTPEALRHVDPLVHADCIPFAFQCRLGGWDELAKALYARGWALRFKEGRDSDLLEELRAQAFSMWEERLADRKSDRKAILRHLTQLIEEEKALQYPENLKLLKQLEFTINYKPKAKPTRVEALIDKLTDHWENPDDPYVVDRAAYWQLVELGFKAVPDLLKHLNDQRLTRSPPISLAEWVTVGYLCRKIVMELSGLRFKRDDEASPEDVAKAKAWFQSAKAIGEEKWVASHVLSSVTQFQAQNVRLLGMKYPARLAAIYRETLKLPASVEADCFVDGIVESKLPREEKIRLMLEGVKNASVSRQISALASLYTLDKPLYRKQLAIVLAQIGDCLKAVQKNRSNLPFYVWSLSSLVGGEDDPKLWDALATIAQRLPFGLRMELLSDVGAVSPKSPEPQSARRERIRFLVKFLDDRTAESDDYNNGEFDRVEVRDFATTQLAGLLGFHVYRTGWHLTHSKETGPLSRLIWRAAVAKKAHEVLNRPKPPG
ncbi:MAG TPA: hypothetical protein VN641_11695 [Urbifossiella sp.]|nr:hypothetical protein [Urbifossiella sp.]